MGSIKQIPIIKKNYLFNDMINIKNFDSSLLKLDKKSNKIINIYYIGYITIKDFHYVKINSVNPLYINFGEADGYIEEEMQISTQFLFVQIKTKNY